ncbi:MAG: transglutaminaseTgpA domain-containing protein [Ornithinibacter sp.]
MNRARPAEAALAGLATLAVSLPLVTLFTPATWFRPSVLLVALVALVGIGMRSVTSSRVLVVLAQTVLLVHGAAVLHGQGHLWRGVVPTPETWRAFGVLLEQAYTTVTDYTAPAPSNRGTILAISLLIGLTAVAVDAAAVTFRSPAAAGIPLLTAFLASATNSGEGLPLWYVLPPAACWLAMIGGQSVRSLRSWGTVAPRTTDGAAADPSNSYATMGRVVGVGALAAAVVLPGLVPHLPTTFLADGLGQSAQGRGGSGSSVRLSSSVDIARDLGSQSTDPVVVYQTTASRLVPLRVAILDSYENGTWEATSNFTFVPIDGQLPAPQAASDVPRAEGTMVVSENNVGVPQVALPTGAVGSPFPAGSWNVSVSGSVQLTERVDNYAVDFVELDPTAEQFRTNRRTASAAADAVNLAVDPLAEPALRELLDELTEPEDSALEVARKVQAYLRGNAFTYSLELAEEAADGTSPEEPLVRFLETKRGYCVQFTSAMVMLARSAGIPARMAVGYLPGSPDGDDQVVRVADAHAWPELYFAQLGWVRFEPTPGTRSGTAPDYSLVPSETGSSSAPTPTASSATPTSESRAGREEDTTTGSTGQDTNSTTGGVGGFLSDNVAIVGVLLLGLLGAAVVPLGAWLGRRRAKRVSTDDAQLVEAEWQSLLLRLQDIGLVPPDGATPRQASALLGRDAYLTADENAALGRVAATLEQARYARPGTALESVEEDSRTVWKAALSRRRRPARLRALLLPQEGLQHWSGLARRLFGRRADQEDEARSSE